MNAMNEFPLSPLPVVGCLIATYIAYAIILPFFSAQAQFFRQQPHAGRKSWLAGLDALTGSRTILADGYKKWSKSNKTFAIPMFGARTTLMIPPSDIHELVNKPDNQVDSMAVLREDLQLYWQGDMDIDKDPMHHDVVRHQLTRKLPILTEAVHQELKVGCEAEWKGATENDWVDVPAFKSCARIVSRAANRVFCGAELCRNPEFLDASLKYAEKFFMAAQLINLTPAWLRPVLAPLMVYPKTRQSLICEKLAVPVIAERLRTREEKNDCISWLIEVCEKKDPNELHANRMCRRLIRLNMAAIHTTSLTMTNTLLDLYTSPQSADFVAGLREECERVYKAHDNKWTKNAVNELHRVDSTLKESMRLSGIGFQALLRKVVQKDGVNIGNTHIPGNTIVAVPSGAIHRDPEFYAAPDSFDAFRFSRSRETLDSDGNIIDKKSQNIVTTNDKFLGFGHGRHACPGRFFASQEMKLMLAHIVMTYDVRVKGERLPNVDFKTTTVPDSKMELQVKLRQR